MEAHFHGKLSNMFELSESSIIVFLPMSVQESILRTTITISGQMISHPTGESKLLRSSVS